MTFAFLLFVACVAVLVGVTLYVSEGRSRRVACLRDLANRLENGRAKWPAGWLETFSGSWVQGRLRGRRVELRIEGDEDGQTLRYELEVPNALASFLVRPVGLLTKLERRVVGAKRGGLAGKYTVTAGWSEYADRHQSGRPARLQQLLREPELERVLDMAFSELKIRDLRLEAERLIVERSLLGNAPLRREALDRAFWILERIALLCERRLVKVTVRRSGRAAVERGYAWTGGTRRVRCPYCHDTLDLGGEVAVCPHCETAHHVACLVEARGCTIFGCEGRRGINAGRA